MSHPLAALTQKLTWQLYELDKQLSSFDEQLALLDQKTQENQQKIIGSSEIPACILPEQEMARLNFMLIQQKQQDDYTTQKKTLLSQRELIKERHIRLKTELKMIEKHQAAKQKHELLQTLRTQQNTVDERFIQYREQA